MTARYEPIPRLNAAEAVRQNLIDAIETGDLQVGERLPPEIELARSFNVSRAVVREALGGLRASGVIDSRPGRGSFVASESATARLLLGRYSDSDLYEVRRNLEVPGAALAAARRTQEECDRLQEVLEELEAERDETRWVALDAGFHVCLAEATRNPVQVRLVQDLRDILVEHSLHAAAVAGRIEQANAEHRAIVRAVVAGSEASARRAMERHLENVDRCLSPKSSHRTKDRADSQTAAKRGVK